MHEEVKELREAHESWESFEGALLEAYGYAKPEGQGRLEFNGLVASVKPHQGAMESLQEFKRCFTRSGIADRWGRTKSSYFGSRSIRGKGCRLLYCPILPLGHTVLL